MRVIIIEDEAPAFRRLQKLLEEHDESIEIIEVLDSVEDSVKWLQNHQQPDLIFSDIQLSDGISFEIYEQVKLSTPVIFTTAFDEYMLKAFRVNSIDYLLKPIKPEELQQAIQKYRDLYAQNALPRQDLGDLLQQVQLNGQQYKSRFLVKQGDRLLSVETDQIAYFMTRHGVVHLVTNENKKYLMDQSLDVLMSQLNPQRFFRVNRQFIVHFPSIVTVHRYHKGKLLVDLKPKPMDDLVVSAEKSSELKEWLDH